MQTFCLFYKDMSRKPDIPLKDLGRETEGDLTKIGKVDVVSDPCVFMFS